MSKMSRTSYDDADMAKCLFAIISGVALVFGAIIMHFVIMIKGWGLSIESWGWMIFLWFCIILVATIKDKILKFIKKEI